MNNNKVLVVEDNAEIRDSLKDILDLNDLSVEVAINGEDAIQILERKPIDLIISDIMMPVKDGYEFIQEIKSRKQYEHIPVIFLTAKALNQDKISGLKIGANDYITKPFEMQELILKVKNLLSLRDQLVQTAYTNPPKIKVESKKDIFLRKVNQAIESQIENPDFSMGALAELLKISPSSLQKKIKSISKKSVSQYIREYRLKRAKDLIASEYGSLSEIATKTGFRSLSYFSKTYKVFFGYSPSSKD
ncbi:response regulator [bacterium]|nr:response regulator [bacterium]